MDYFNCKLIVVCLILFVSDGVNGWYPCLAHILWHILFLWVFCTINTPQSTAHPVDFVHTIWRAIGMQKLVDMGWSTLQSQPYQEQGRLGIHTLRLSLTCLSPRDVVVLVVNACALLTVHWYTSQEHGVEAAHAFIMISGGNPMVKARRTRGWFCLVLRERYKRRAFVLTFLCSR